MVIGDILQSVSTQNIARNVSGLGSYISTYFEPTATQPQYKPNREWNNPINKMWRGCFGCTTRMCMECLATMQHWDKILKYWQPMTSDACVSLNKSRLESIVCQVRFPCQGNARHGSMRLPLSQPSKWSRRRTTWLGVLSPQQWTNGAPKYTRSSQTPQAWVDGAHRQLLARRTPRLQSLWDADACGTAVAITVPGTKKRFSWGTANQGSLHIPGNSSSRT